MNGADECRFMVVLPELAAHLADKHVNVSIIRVPLPIANPVHELVSSHDFTRVFDQGE